MNIQIDAKKKFDILFYSILLIGTLIRLVRLNLYSFWYDEAWRALIACNENWLEKLRTNIAPQPLLFIGMHHYIPHIFGNTETVYRITGAILGSISLLLIYLIVASLTNKTIGLISMFLMAFQPQYIYFSREFKTYSYDIFFVLIMIYLCERMVSKSDISELNWNDYGLFCLFLFLSPFFSIPVLFIVPAIYIILLFYKKNNIVSIIKLLLSGILFITIYLIHYRLILAPQESKFIEEVWSSRYFDLSQPIFNNIYNLLGATYNMFSTYVYHRANPFGIYFMDLITTIIIILFVLGLINLFKKGVFRVFIYIFTPYLLMILFACFNLWPFGPTRLNLFFFPLLLVPLSYQLGSIYLALSRKQKANMTRLYAYTILTALIFFPFNFFNTSCHLPYHVLIEQDIRPGIKVLLENAKGFDAICVTCPSEFDYYYYYYSPFTKYPKIIRKDKMFYSTDPSGDLDFKLAFSRNKRVWVVFCSTLLDKEDIDKIKKDINRYGEKLLGCEKEQMFVYLYRSKLNLN